MAPLAYIRPSLISAENGSLVQPFGEGVNASLTSLLEFGEKEGFTVKNLDGYAGHIVRPLRC
jgi:hypothetical protein